MRGCIGGCSLLGRGDVVGVAKVDIIEGGREVVGSGSGGVVGVGVGVGGDGGIGVGGTGC